MMTLKIFLILSFIVTVSACSDSPQQADPDFKPQNKSVSFADGSGPTVLIDEAHNNFLTLSGRYKPFAQVIRSDGFKVRSNTKIFTENALKQADILVIANALDKDRKDWLPPYGYALNNNEVEVVKNWITQGGSLFLVADHAPFPKVIENLALALGFKFSNGHVGNATFSKANRSLAAHTITYEKKETQNTALILQVRTFGGSAFKAPENALSLLNLGPRAVSLEPEIPFQVTANTPRIPMDRWSQGAVTEFGKGRIAVFSEGMMFSSQIDTKTGKKYGFTSKGAEQNEQFLLNVMYWLAGVN